MARAMKDSGIEWIGEIPEGWMVSKLQYFIDCYDGRRVPVDAAERTPGPYPYWGAGSIMDYVNDYLFDEELLLLGEDGAPFFDYTRPVAFYSNEKIWVNNHIHVLKPHADICIKYLLHYLNNVDYKSYINGSIGYIFVRMDLYYGNPTLGFIELITKAALDSVNAIESLEIIDDIDVLKDTIEEPSFARKLSRIKNTSPIFRLGITKEQIVEFSKTNPGLAGGFKYSEDGSRIRLDTKKSKQLFLKMMNDSFLRSELTKQYYEASAKDNLTDQT